VFGRLVREARDITRSCLDRTGAILRNKNVLARRLPDRHAIWRAVIILATSTVAFEDTNMVMITAVYQPELIELMKSVLDEAATILPKTRQTSAMKVKLASRILAAAAKGERDPIQLRIAALLEPVGE
jgi:hypothetical protein